MYRSFFVSILFLLLSAPAVLAQPSPKSAYYPQLPDNPTLQTFAGNWKVTLTNPETEEEVVKYIKMEPPLKETCEPVGTPNCVRKIQIHPEKRWTAESVKPINNFTRAFSFSGTSMTFGHSSGTMGHWGSDSKISFSGDSGTGTWVYQNRSGIVASGTEIWERANVKIDRIDFYRVDAEKDSLPISATTSDSSGIVRGTYSERKWGETNRVSWQRPKFALDIYGDGLWGFHVFDIKDGPALDAGSCSAIHTQTKADNIGVSGLRCWVSIYPGVTNGLKTLRLDNVEIPVNLDVERLPETPDEDIIKVKIGDLIIDKKPYDLRKRENTEQLATLKEAARDKKEAVEYQKRRFDSAFMAYVKTVKVLDAKLRPLREAFDVLESDDPNYRAAKDVLWVEQQDYNRRFKIAEGRLKDFVNAYDQAEIEFGDSVEASYQAYDKSLELDNVVDRELIQVSIVPTFLAKKTDRNAALKELNSAIAEAELALYWADQAREEARLEMTFASDMVTLGSENLVTGMYASTISQTAVEAGFQIQEALKQAKNGPAALTFWTVNQLKDNLLIPPNIYEPDYTLNEKRTVLSDVIEGYHLSDGKAKEKAREYAKKTFWNTLKSGTSTYLTKDHLRFEMSKLANEMGLPLDSATRSDLQKIYAKQNDLFKATDKSWKDKTFRSGAGKFTASWGKALIQEQFKGVVKEVAKRDLAEFFEGQAWRSYIAAEQDFAFTVRVFKMKGNIYWRNRDLVYGLKGLRDTLTNKEFDKDTGFQFDRNNEFDLKESTQVWLFFTGDDADQQTGVDMSDYEGPISVSLEGVSLNREQDGNRFSITSSGFNQIKAKDKDTLNLKVVFD